MWLCECDCGNETIVNGSALTSGATKSCRCLQVDLLKRPSIERFWEKVTIRDKDDCWEWQGGLQSKKEGYGQFWTNGKQIGAHRYSWILHYGKIKKGLYVLHKCDNRICVNPKHLFLGTITDNHKDMVAKKRHVFGENVHSAKLTNSDILKIMDLIKKGIKQVEISKLFNVAQSQISAIKCGITWKQVEV
jgi:hypothetical protein